MNDSDLKRRDSMYSPRMSPPPHPQRVYITSGGQRLSEHQFQQRFRNAQAESQRVTLHPRKLQETLWLLSQHHPNHPMLEGRPVQPPPGTVTSVLQQFGFHAEQQPQGTASPQWPNFAPTALSMVPPNIEQVQQGGVRVQPARQATGIAQLDPRLANASGISQTPGYPTPSPSQTSPQATTNASSTSPQAPISWPSPSIAEYQRVLDASQASPQAKSRPLLMHSQRQCSHSFLATTPSQPLPYNIDHAQTARLAVPTRRPSFTSVSPQVTSSKGFPITPQEGYANDLAPRMGMFPPPPPRPTNTHGVVAPTQHERLADIVDSRLNKKTSKRGGSRMETSEQKFPADNMTTEQVQSYDEMKAATLASWGTEERTQVFVQLHRAQALNKQTAAVYTKGAKNQSLGPASASDQTKLTRQGTVVSARKRKDAPTTDDQPKKKHQFIDLTGNKPQRERHPISRGDSQEPNRGFGSNTTIIPSARKSSAHTQVRPQDLHAHAMQYGVHMFDVELNGNILKSQQAWSMNQEAIRKARSLLDPSADKMQRMGQQNAMRQPLVYVAEPTHIAAVRKVKTGSYDYTWSSGDVDKLTPASEAGLAKCTQDANGGLHAPEDIVISEEQADLLFRLHELTRQE